jgi:hypothetical protein
MFAWIYVQLEAVKPQFHVFWRHIFLRSLTHSHFPSSHHHLFFVDLVVDRCTTISGTR